MQTYIIILISDIFLRLSLKSTDLDYLEKFCKFMNYDENFIKHNSIINKETGKTYFSVTATLNSIHLTNELTKLGCMQGKSLIVKYPEWLDDKLHLHFIRGLFDGDGSIKSRASKDNTLEWNWSITGTKEICEATHKIYSEIYGISISYHQSSNDSNINTWTIESSGNLKVQKICDLMYKNASIYLDGKYHRYQNLCKFNLTRHPNMFQDSRKRYSSNI